MIRIGSYSILVLFLLSFYQIAVADADSPQGPSHVEIKQKAGRYQLYVNGSPFYVKGAGLASKDGQNFKALKEAGGNAFRTWRTDNADAELAAAKKYGLMVAMGIDIEKELHGFDYNDEAAVARQFESVKKQINRYKDHPNLLCWVVGNELNLLFNEQGGLKLVNPKVYDALADIIDYIHQVDPHHPVTYTYAGAIPEHIKIGLKRTPQVDFLSVQVYGFMPDAAGDLEKAGIDVPFMITEYGPLGHWEVPKTKWGREIEEASTPKAIGIMQRIKRGFVDEPSERNIGNFIFLWGQKQERTPTWFGIFTQSGEATQTLDVITKHWTDKYPTNQAPHVYSLTINDKKAIDNVYLKPGQRYKARVAAYEPDDDELRYRWIIMKEVVERSDGGAFEQQPDGVRFKKISDKNGVLEFIAPRRKGDYRLFVYVSDGRGKVGYANTPFYIEN